MATDIKSTKWRESSDNLIRFAAAQLVPNEDFARLLAVQRVYKRLIADIDSGVFESKPLKFLHKALEALNKRAQERELSLAPDSTRADQRAHVYEKELVRNISDQLQVILVARILQEEAAARMGEDPQVAQLLGMACDVESIVCETGKLGDFRVTRNNSGFADYGHSTSGLANGGIPTVNIGDNALEPSHCARKSAGGHRSRHKRAELSGPGRWFRGAVLVAAAFFVASIPGNSQEPSASTQTGTAPKPALK